MTLNSWLCFTARHKIASASTGGGGPDGRVNWVCWGSRCNSWRAPKIKCINRWWLPRRRSQWGSRGCSRAQPTPWRICCCSTSPRSGQPLTATPSWPGGWTAMSTISYAPSFLPAPCMHQKVSFRGRKDQHSKVCWFGWFRAELVDCFVEVKDGALCGNGSKNMSCTCLALGLERHPSLIMVIAAAAGVARRGRIGGRSH